MMAGVTKAPGEYRLYQDLAGWWPLISPLEEYAADAAVLLARVRVGRLEQSARSWTWAAAAVMWPCTSRTPRG